SREVNDMLAIKQEVLKVINQLPEDADMDEIMYRLYVLDKIKKGQEAVAQAETLTSEQLKREIDAW
ncbi:MAG: hypothetical protein Q8M91_11645, partial [Polaromonas sp.]|nr:hypothetical protein [Polaromonas sp.]